MSDIQDQSYLPAGLSIVDTARLITRLVYAGEEEKGL